MLPRPIQILAGLFVAAASLLVLMCGAAMLIGPRSDHIVGWVVMGLIVEAGALWGLIKGADLIFGWHRHNGLIGPVALRVIATIYTMVTVAMLVQFAHRPWPELLGPIVGGITFVAALLALAQERQQARALNDARNVTVENRAHTD